MFYVFSLVLLISSTSFCCLRAKVPCSVCLSRVNSYASTDLTSSLVQFTLGAVTLLQYNQDFLVIFLCFLPFYMIFTYRFYTCSPRKRNIEVFLCCYQQQKKNPRQFSCLLLQYVFEHCAKVAETCGALSQAGKRSNLQQEHLSCNSYVHMRISLFQFRLFLLLLTGKAVQATL